MRRPNRITPLTLALVVGVGLAASTTAVYAAGAGADGTHLRGQWVNGGQSWLELEDRNVKPAICFIWENSTPQDGDSIESRILNRSGGEVVTLGTGDQWVSGSAKGCELPRDDRYLNVFAHPGNYIFEFRVVENQGTPPTSPVRSHPLQRSSK